MKKFGLVCTTLLCTLITLGGLGTVGAGLVTDWTFDINNVHIKEFEGVEVKDQIKTHTGSALTLDYVIPDTAKVLNITITNAQGEVVSECIDIGVYNFELTIKSGDKVKIFNAKLEIVSEVLVNTTQNSKLQLKVLSVETLATGETVQTVGYTVNGNLDPQKIVGALAWTDTSYDQDISTFVTPVLDKNAKTIKLTCLKPFDHQMTYSLYSEELSEAKASLTIDYMQKVTKEANVSFTASSTSFGDELHITTSVTAPTYSIGSILIDNKPSENLTWSYGWTNAGGKTLNSIMPSTSMIKKGEDGSGVYYQNETYGVSELSNVITAIETNVNNYFRNLISTKNVTVSLQTLKDLFTYSRNVRQSYGGYVRVATTELFDLFVTNYNREALTYGAFIEYTATAYNKNKTLSFNKIEATKTVGDLSINDGNIIF